MTGQELQEARQDLGVLWGLGRPLYASELGRVLQMTGRDPGVRILIWERGEARIPGPAALAIELMLRGAKPRAVVNMGFEA